MIDISISAVQQKVIREAYYKRLTDWITKKKLWSRTGNARANQMMRFVRTYSKYYFLSPADQLILRRLPSHERFLLALVHHQRVSQTRG